MKQGVVKLLLVGCLLGVAIGVFMGVVDVAVPSVSYACDKKNPQDC